ncbi:uncharacterized protein AB675_7915 [Cyphellophora attinorum]|uniref:Uncharacterized protein n=1 Tax=Cyphellophora attinorum TaxID=1664694 RepID=A0A0N0NN14_9EURO|nr:uncharacterized protein AB675_7915 [Phialophora attinorum]KPI41081.1 hypothetical protein AB675_7915 [Phialophora attinorum]
MAPVSHEAYAQPVARSASVMPERAPARTVYLDDRSGFREPVRMGSVRPMPQYEDAPREPVMRAASVRPVGREPVYAPIDQPRYRVAEQPGQRYFDEHGREIIMQRF